MPSSRVRSRAGRRATAAEAPRAAAPRTARARRDGLAGYAFVAPALIGLSLFLLVPVAVLAWLSFQRWDLLGPITPAGFDNWQRALGDAGLWHSVGITLLFVALAVPIETAIGVILARLLARDLPGSAVVRTVLLLPWVCAPIVLGIVWHWMLEPTGVFGHLLGTRVEWLTQPAPAFILAVLVTVWTKVGYITLFFLAGLSAIPAQLREAALTDGANAWQTFWRIELPMLRPTMFFVLVTSVIEGFQTFDLIYALTPNGGPQGATDLIAARIYHQAFSANDLGSAAVTALILFAMLLVITVAQQRWFAGRTTYERA